MNSTKAPTALTASQIGVLAGVGAALWFLAAMILRTLGPLDQMSTLRILLIFALVIPGTVPFVLLTRTLASLRREQTAIGTAVVTATAALLDAVAIIDFPALYGADPLGAAATILWGVGVGLFLGVLMNRPAP